MYIKKITEFIKELFTSSYAYNPIPKGFVVKYPNNLSAPPPPKDKRCKRIKSVILEIKKICAYDNFKLRRKFFFK